MRVKNSTAAAIVLGAVGVALAAGLLAGVAVAKAAAADPPPMHCPCPRSTITT